MLISLFQSRGKSKSITETHSAMRAKNKKGGSSRIWERGHFSFLQRGDNRSAFQFVMETFCQPSNSDVKVAVAQRLGQFIQHTPVELPEGKVCWILHFPSLILNNFGEGLKSVFKSQGSFCELQQILTMSSWCWSFHSRRNPAKRHLLKQCHSLLVWVFFWRVGEQTCTTKELHQIPSVCLLCLGVKALLVFTKGVFQKCF